LKQYISKSYKDGAVTYYPNLIFGNSLKNENENRLVFETVSKYIARTKRFDST
jgi:hypothetical protein